VSRAWGTSPKEQFPTLHSYAAYGCLGVEAFFVISGFVNRMSGWGRSLTSFFASPASRLLPAYWAAVVLVRVADHGRCADLPILPGPRTPGLAHDPPTPRLRRALDKAR
jgi:peptidoglycan/LPS O-acetylase OafA/YrhL